MASPTTRLNSEHQLLNQMHHQSLQQHQQRHQIASNARLPPDLLPYGQHQSLTLKNSLNNSSSCSSGSSSGGSTVIIDHRTQTYISNNKYDAYAASYDDDIIDGITMNNVAIVDDDDDNDGTDPNDSGRLFLSEKHLIRRPSDEPDLRIYHHDIVGSIGTNSVSSMKSTTSQKPFSLLGSSSTTTMTIASGKTTTLLPSHRFKNYDFMTSPTPQTITTKNNNNNNYPFYNNMCNMGSTTTSTAMIMTSSPQAVIASTHSNLKSSESVSNASAPTTNCKLRQSIVRTSPSFSFLSTGYHQQQDNFLWCFTVLSMLTRHWLFAQSNKKPECEYIFVELHAYLRKSISWIGSMPNANAYLLKRICIINKSYYWCTRKTPIADELNDNKNKKIIYFNFYYSLICQSIE